MRCDRFQIVAVLAVGAVGGWLAASDRLPSLSQSNAAEPTQAATAALALAPAHADEAIVFEILVPGNAELEIDGQKTKETGESRQFQTPPLPAGEHFNYTVKATAG